MNIEQSTLFDMETPRERYEREVKEMADRAAKTGGEVIRKARMGEATSEAVRNPGTQRMIEELGGGEPRETLAVDPPHFAEAPHKLRPTGHVRDFESDRDHELAEVRAAYAPPTAPSPESAAIVEEVRKKLEIDNAIQRVERAHENPDPYYLDKDAEAKERELNVEMRKIHNRRQNRASH